MRWIAAAGSVVSLAGCILFVSEPARGTQCRFEGSDSLCGACVRERCQPEVNACCADATCNDTMSALDRCAAQNDDGCAALLATSQGLGACIAERCAGPCQHVVGTSTTACKELPLAPAVSCSCVTSATPNAFTCSESVFTGTRCCAPKGWPGVGLQCTCRHVSCNPTGDGCFCSLVDYTPEQQACDGAFCCVDPARSDQCTCRATPCRANERRVSACTVDVLECGPQTRVASCSMRGL